MKEKNRKAEKSEKFEKSKKAKNEWNIESEQDTGSHRYQNIGMGTGMCLGMCLGMCFGSLLSDNTAVGISMGMSMGLCVGMCLGIVIGAQKDRQINASALTIREIIEDEFGCEGRPEGEIPMVTIVVADKDGAEKPVRMSDELAYERKLEVGKKVLLCEDGTLKLLEEENG